MKKGGCYGFTLKKRIGKMLEYIKKTRSILKMEIKNYKMIRWTKDFRMWRIWIPLCGGFSYKSRSGAVIRSITGFETFVTIQRI